MFSSTTPYGVWISFDIGNRIIMMNYDSQKYRILNFNFMVPKNPINHSKHSEFRPEYSVILVLAPDDHLKKPWHFLGLGGLKYAVKAFFSLLVYDNHEDIFQRCSLTPGCSSTEH